MNAAYEKLLNELFDELDADRSEFLDVRAFALLGEAINGAKAPMNEAQAQLERADKDGDGMVSRSEWIDFSVILGRLDEHTFTKVIGGYLQTVRKIQAKRRARAAAATLESK